MSTTTLGQGLNYPYKFHLGVLEPAAGVKSVEAALKMLLSTPIGSRFMLPEYGSNLPLLLFEPCDDQTAIRAEAYVGEAVQQWIPRIRSARVNATPEPDRHRLVVSMTYTLINDPTARTFVYPFYLQTE